MLQQTVPYLLDRNIATELMMYEYYFGLLEARYPSRTETGYGLDGRDILMRFPTGTMDFTQQAEHLWGPPIPYPAGTGTSGAIPPISGKPYFIFLVQLPAAFQRNAYSVISVAN